MKKPPIGLVLTQENAHSMDKAAAQEACEKNKHIHTLATPLVLCENEREE